MAVEVAFLSSAFLASRLAVSNTNLSSPKRKLDSPSAEKLIEIDNSVWIIAEKTVAGNEDLKAGFAGIIAIVALFCGA
jgi:hypothetical protein